MDTELRELLLRLGLYMLIGMVIGLTVRRLRPAWARRWQKFCLNRQWKLFMLAAIMFGAGAVILWMDGQIYHAVLSGALCVLEIVAMFRHGFKSLTPEMERQIDAS
jgi:ABC-type uncharacterized transport system permease subunit